MPKEPVKCKHRLAYWECDRCLANRPRDIRRLIRELDLMEGFRRVGEQQKVEMEQSQVNKV